MRQKIQLEDEAVMRTTVQPADWPLAKRCLKFLRCVDQLDHTKTHEKKVALGNRIADLGSQIAAAAGPKFVGAVERVGV